jgi:hypothetical protein
MPATKRGEDIRRRLGTTTRGSSHDGTAARHYIVYRASTQADGALVTQYEVPGIPAPLDEAGFASWRQINAPVGQQDDRLSILIIRELLDVHGSILTCALERRRGSLTGRYHGAPARVTFAGAADQVRLHRATASGALREIIPSLDQRPPPVARRDHFAGEEASIRAVFGTATQILDTRGPTLLEELIGLTSILHIRAPSGVEIDCGLGWHGTTPFLLRADFPRFDAAPALPVADAAAIAVAAVTSGLTTYEARTDAQGPAVLARANCEGTLHLLRPQGNSVGIEPYLPGIQMALLNADQAIWVRYAETHEHLVMLDAYPDGRADGVFVLAATQAGQVTRHLIDADGVEVWRATADDTAIAAVHRERVIGPPGC